MSRADRGTALNDLYVTVNGMRLHCVTGGEGPLMLCLHGFPEFWYEWKEQLREFGKGRLVVAPDLRGYNLSDKPAEMEAYRVQALLEDIRGLADHFRQGRKFVLVGHDWGGALAWGFAAAHPELLEKLVIINAPHPAIFQELLMNDPGQQQASQYMLMFRSPGAEAMLLANDCAILVENVLGGMLRSGIMTEADRAEYVKAWQQPGALTGGLNYYRANEVGPPTPEEMGMPAAANAFMAGAAQMKVRVPALVIWGEKDTALTINNLEGLEKYVPELKICRVPEGSHWVVHEKSAEVNGYIREFIG
ncbi:MAG TPA: alpha/beta hydrolase [Candidatus Acidoferrum sp.]|nr:alpha/beta hydrolase [Candidatus Acidoferrum sp.]